MTTKEKYQYYCNVYGLEDVSELYPDADYFEKSIISFRKAGWTYEGIQKMLGNPAKKTIRLVLLKYDRNLIEQNN